MAMTVMHNASAQLSLGELNKNINKLGKALAIVASGQKINGAKDDSASFAISEVMREKIRSLEQDVQNVQNGSAMLKTAEGGIQNIVDELRELRELAIDAANDSNTDDDRRVLQKVLDQKRANIEDIAVSTNYNGKRLLDGAYVRPMGDIEYFQVGMKTRITVTGNPPSVTKIPNRGGGYTIRQDNKFPDVYGDLTQIDNSITKQTTNVRSGNGVECDFGFSGSNNGWCWSDEFGNDEAAKTYGNEIFSANNASQQEVIQGFMKSLDASTRNSGSKALDDAVKICSDGKFSSFDDLKAQFISDLQSNPGTFLSTYCGIDLTNADTGAISGADAGGSNKSAADVVPENNFASWTDPTPGSSSTFDGLTVNWPSTGASGTLTANEEAILRGLNGDWIQQSLDLISDTYGMDFQEGSVDTTFGSTNINTLNVTFIDSTDTRTAYITNDGSSFNLNINMAQCDNLTTPYEENGEVGTEYLDRTVAHELTKAVIDANVKNVDAIPSAVKQGIAHLTTGADDVLASEIQSLINDPSTISTALNSGTDNAAAGYMLMRYLANQSEGGNISLNQVTYSPAPSTQGQIGVNLNFDMSTINSLGDLHGDGFSILCGGCGQYISFNFDSTIGVSDSTFVRSAEDSNKGNYTIGIRDIDITDGNDLAKAIFDGVSVCALSDRNSTDRSQSDITVTNTNLTSPDDLVSLVVDGNHGLRIAKNPSGDGYVFVKDSSPAMDFITQGTVLAVEYGGEVDDLPDDEGETITLTEPTEINIGPPIYAYREYQDNIGNPLTIHHGTKSNEAINVFIKSMRTSALHVPVPNVRDVEQLLRSTDFVTQNRELVDTADQLKTALEAMEIDIAQIKRSPLIDIINELDSELQREISDKTLPQTSELNEYPQLRRFFEGSVNPIAPSDSDSNLERVFNIDVFIGNLKEYPDLQPMLEAVMINHAIVNRAEGESIDLIKAASDKTLDEITFTGTSAPPMTPVQSSKAALRVIDSAITYALEQATYVGANLARLEYTDANLNTEVDNVQAADSTIRDADMAKAMTEYTKNNVLAQASQSMLAQANQNLSGVLSLLQ